MNDLAQIGPVQLISVSFESGVNFEGRIADELARLESERTIRVLDLLFVARDPDSEELVVLEHQEESMGAIVGALLGLRLDDDSSVGSGAQAEHAFGLTEAEIQEMGASLPPGGSAGLLLVEHVWARKLKRAIRDAGGRTLGEGFLTPETVAAVEPQLAALSHAVRAGES
jgi:uncharacterized membrane protein